MAVHDLAKIIRTEYYNHAIQQVERGSLGLDESSRQRVTVQWIDHKEREWTESRRLVQSLEYRRSEPPDDRDTQAARNFIRRFSVHESPAEIVRQWSALFGSQKQQLAERFRHVTMRLSQCDKSLPEWSRGQALAMRLSHELKHLPFFVAIE